MKALQIREKYMAKSLQNFCHITSNSLLKQVDFDRITKFEPEYQGSQPSLFVCVFLVAIYMYLFVGQSPSASAPYKPFGEPTQSDNGFVFEMNQGVVHVYANEADRKNGKLWSNMPNINLDEFVRDSESVFLACINGPL